MDEEGRGSGMLGLRHWREKRTCLGLLSDVPLLWYSESDLQLLGSPDGTLVASCLSACHALCWHLVTEVSSFAPSIH